jgi:hypothetical protein
MCRETFAAAILDLRDGRYHPRRARTVDPRQLQLFAAVDLPSVPWCASPALVSGSWRATMRSKRPAQAPQEALPLQPIKLAA